MGVIKPAPPNHGWPGCPASGSPSSLETSSFSESLRVMPRVRGIKNFFGPNPPRAPRKSGDDRTPRLVLGPPLATIVANAAPARQSTGDLHAPLSTTATTSSSSMRKDRAHPARSAKNRVYRHHTGFIGGQSRSVNGRPPILPESSFRNRVRRKRRSSVFLPPRPNWGRVPARAICGSYCRAPGATALWRKTP